MNAIDFRADVPEALARAAHNWTSHTPEVRGEQEIAGYAARLASDFENLSRLATTDDKRAELTAQFERYRAGYRRRFLAYLAARSRCASAMITGPANFPVERNRKANVRADKHSSDLEEYRKRALWAIQKALTPELAPIMSGDADAADRLRAKIADAKASQERMRAANAAIRKLSKAGEAAQIAALVELGFSEALARETLKPDCFGYKGYAPFELTNNNANIKRMEARLAGIERAQSTPTTEQEGASGVRMEDAPAENRVRLHFPGKPDVEIRTRLKRNGFRWAPSQGAWSAYRNPGSLALAREIAGLKGGCVS